MREIPLSSQLNDLLYFAKNCFTGYPYSAVKDPAYFEHLLDEFSELNLLLEMKLYYAWILDSPEFKPIPYRMLFRLWLMHSRTFGSAGMNLFQGKDALC